MLVEWYFIVIVVIASLSLGLIIGLILRSIFRGENGKSEKVSQKANPSELPKKRPTNPRLVEVARLSRDRQDRKLVFQVGKEYYKHGTDLTNKDKELLLNVIMDFYKWLEPESKRQPENAVSLKSQDTVTNRSTQSYQNFPFTNRIPDRDDPKTDFNPVNVLSQALLSDIRQSTLPAQSVVSQVDEILQENLEAAGMKNWAIRLKESHQQGMVVMVGMDQYDGIDDVPFEQVRKIIRESVSEWEHRAEDGKIG
jgi:hypothetical protein